VSDDWHAVLITPETLAAARKRAPWVNGDTIGTGKFADGYEICKSHWHYGEAALKR
jgi:hypothetical protein